MCTSRLCKNLHSLDLQKSWQCSSKTQTTCSKLPAEGNTRFSDVQHKLNHSFQLSFILTVLPQSHVHPLGMCCLSLQHVFYTVSRHTQSPSLLLAI